VVNAVDFGGKPIEIAALDESGRPAGGGFYTLNEGLMTMIDGDGTPIHKPNGDFFTCRLKGSENRNAIAKTMTTEVYRFVHGLTQEHTSPTGFNRVFNYPSSGVA
jgi:hypothetical protein